MLISDAPESTFLRLFYAEAVERGEIRFHTLDETSLWAWQPLLCSKLLSGGASVSRHRLRRPGAFEHAPPRTQQELHKRRGQPHSARRRPFLPEGTDSAT